MKVLFVFSRDFAESPTKPLAGMKVIQLGVSLLSAVLKRHRHQTRLLVLTHDTPFSLVDKTMEEFVPDMVCFTAVSSEFDFIVAVAKHIQNL